MGKKSYILIAGVAVILIAALLLKGYVQTGEAKAAANNKSYLWARYTELKSSGRPAMIVFTYDADCCETTRVFFEEYNGKVKLVTEKYKDKLGILIINAGILDEVSMQAMIDIAEENNVTELPSILLLSKKGEPNNVIPGKFDGNELENLIDGLVND